MREDVVVGVKREGMVVGRRGRGRCVFLVDFDGRAQGEGRGGGRIDR